MKQAVKQEYTIFSALFDTIQEQSRGKLRFAKCLKCRRLTPYKLKSMENSEISCKRCKNPIMINY